MRYWICWGLFVFAGGCFATAGAFQEGWQGALPTCGLWAMIAAARLSWKDGGGE